MNKLISPAQVLREHIKGPAIVVAPGVYDHMSLLIAKKFGFQAFYASGYWSAASTLGEPDVGIAGASDFLEVFGRFVAKARQPIIADADTGFGSLTNLDRAVKAYQRAGIAAIQIEDQDFPKICGHVGHAKSVPTPDMVRRVKVAIEARGDGDIQIIARTDSRRTEGLEAAIDRLHAYAAAGADIVFLEGPQNEEEITQAADALHTPLMLNAAHGGVTPILAPSRYQALGVKLVIYPGAAALSAAHATNSFYRGLANDDANITAENMFDFDEMSQLLGMDDVVAFQKRHGAP